MMPAMVHKTQSRLTSQGQVSVPAAVRRLLQLTPGSVLVWTADGERVTVERARQHSTAEVHQALFEGQAPAAPAVATDEGIRRYMRRRHAGR